MSPANTEIARKRSILFAARLKFSPETQPIRETAIDKIVEQNMLIADTQSGLTATEIINQGTVCFANGTPALSQRDVEDSLGRLLKAGRLDRVGEDKDRMYRLSEDARLDLDDTRTNAENRFERVLRRLFRDSRVDLQRYSAPFLECLCLIFSKLGDIFVQSIKGDIAPDTLHQVPSVMDVLARIPTKYPDLDSAAFTRAIISFFRDIDPEYDQIKWNLAQNYYIARALGLDQGGSLLSKEIFGGSAIYLGTNVIIQAVEPSARHHRSIASLCKACQRLGISLHVCQISLDELRRVVSYWRDILPKIVSQIPDKTAPKIREFIVQLYMQRIAVSGAADLDELFAPFEDPAAVLRSSYDVELVDDDWFDQAEKDAITKRLTERIIKESTLRKKRAKNEKSGLHDALLFRWVEREFANSGKKSWIVTLDMLLPSFAPISERANGSPLAISLTAFLQWISPMALSEESEDDLARIFSEAISYQLLPQDNFFDMRDFLVFAGLEWSCKELPAEDVENCIRYIKQNAPGLDMSDPKDREKAASVISRFFADPSRKYKQELQQMERDTLVLSQEHESKQSSLRQEVSEANEEIAKLKTELEKVTIAAQADRDNRSMQNSARQRLLWSLLVFVILESAATYFSLVYGEGGNAFQKLLHSWEILTLTFGMSLASAWFIIGKERLKVLGWPLGRILKGED